mmetsp:Transcript_66591/g.214594  ORF Transcript_66591/g.214594 Transcript_66591/m.214594 type:complete len:189 (-) Transcript_66591:159-725(-)
MLPMFHMELAPTDYALRMRPAFIAMLLLLGAVVLGKFLIRDVWGAVCLLFVIITGLFVLGGQYRVNASSALFFCVMAVTSGIFDVIGCILYFQHSKYGLLHPQAPGLVLLAQVVFLISPLALLSSALLSYSIFSDCRDNSQETLPMRDGDLDYASLMEATQPVQQTQSASRGVLVPFQGRGLRLGEAD